MAKLQSGTRIYGTANIDSTLIVGNVTSSNATSNTTGTIQVIGGMGVTGNIYVGNVFTSGGVYDANTKLPIAGGGGGSINIYNDLVTSTAYYPMLSALSVISSNGNTLSTTYTSNTKLYFTPLTGTLSATTFNSLSDQTLKINTESLVDGIQTIIQLNPVSFNWKDTGQKAYGVIAQEIENVIPEIVTTTGTIKSVSYDQIIPFLIQAVKELKLEIEELKSRM